MCLTLSTKAKDWNSNLDSVLPETNTLLCCELTTNVLWWSIDVSMPLKLLKSCASIIQFMKRHSTVADVPLSTCLLPHAYIHDQR